MSRFGYHGEIAREVLIAEAGAAEEKQESVGAVSHTKLRIYIYATRTLRKSIDFSYVTYLLSRISPWLKILQLTRHPH